MKPSFVISILVWLILPRIYAAEGAAPPASFTYILQADAFSKTKAGAVARLAGCGRDWIVLDAAFSDDTPWQRTDLDVIRDGRDKRKIIAYISIGEAEDYRPYWRKAWGSRGHLSANAPAWLGAENPDWPGNYRVNYWDRDWQALLLPAIDAAMECGFDGIYLDIVDGFETFEAEGDDSIDNRINPATKQSYRRDMVDWVKVIAARARARNPAALVIPQNGAQLLLHDDYLTTISGIGIEDLFTNGNKPQSQSHTREVVNYTRLLGEGKKPVLLIEYPKKETLQSAVKQRSKELGMTCLITDRSLKTLGISGEN